MLGNRADTERQTEGGGSNIRTSDTSRAVAAAVSIAAALDLPVDDAVVLQDANRLALRLLPCDVMARVAHVGQEVAAFEVELARRLAETESPVAAARAASGAARLRAGRLRGHAVDLLRVGTRTTSRQPSTRTRSCGCMPACGRSIWRRRTSRIGSRKLSNCVGEPRPHSGARRRGPGTSRRHIAKPAPSHPGPRRRRAAAARRAASGQRAQHAERVAVHRPGDVLPWACRVRPRPCARRCQRALSGR